MELKDQVVLVTGSNRGLGLAILRAFKAEGSRVIMNYLKSKETAKSLARELDCIAIQADVTDPDQVKALFQQAEQHYGSPITTIVNNALASFSFNGEKARAKLDSITWEGFDAQIQGSLRGALNTTQAAILSFKKSGFGRIINIGTNLVQNPVVPYHDYTAAKGALLAFTRTCAAELGPNGVTVNMVSGGLLKVTDASRETPEEVFGLIEGVTPLRRVCRPEDLVGSVLFFASGWAECVTGQNLVVDGGLVMS